MTDAFQAMIERHRARMVELRQAFERDGRLHAVNKADHGYSILLTINGSSDAPFRVTSFRGKEPVGHREYDRLDGGPSTQNAPAEFAGAGWNLKPLSKRMHECRSGKPRKDSPRVQARSAARRTIAPGRCSNAVSASGDVASMR